MAVRTQRDLAIVKRLRELIHLESARFGRVGVPDPSDPLPKSESEVDAFIKRRLQLWRQSWIDPLLNELEGTGACFDGKLPGRGRIR